jgi:hypothetical protein
MMGKVVDDPKSQLGVRTGKMEGTITNHNEEASDD